MQSLKKYLDANRKKLIQDKKNRPNKQSVKETIEHYARENENNRADEEILNTPTEELQDYAQEVSDFISQYVDENWTN